MGTLPTVPSSDIKAAKQALRRTIRHRRRTRSVAEHQAATAGFGRADVIALLSQIATPSGGLIASYTALPDYEPDPAQLHLRWRAAGGQVAHPRTGTDRAMTWVVDPATVHIPDSPPRIPHPVGDALPGTLWQHTRCVVIPALAATETGARLGQGGGFYDTLLAGKPADATILAVVCDDEVLPDSQLPTEAHDQPVDKVVTPTRIIHATAPTVSTERP